MDEKQSYMSILELTAPLFLARYPSLESVIERMRLTDVDPQEVIALPGIYHVAKEVQTKGAQVIFDGKDALEIALVATVMLKLCTDINEMKARLNQ